jgi:hypothetical protein
MLLALREEMSEEGPSNRLLKSMEEEEKRQQWAPRRGIKDENRRRFGDVIGLHFPHDNTERRYFRKRAEE